MLFQTNRDAALALRRSDCPAAAQKGVECRLETVQELAGTVFASRGTSTSRRGRRSGLDGGFSKPPGGESRPQEVFMRGNWLRWVLILAACFVQLVVVSDAQAIWPFRRRVRYTGNYGYTYPTRYNYTTGYGTYGTMPSAGVDVTGTGVGVSAGPAGAAVSAAGVGVNGWTG